MSSIQIKSNVKVEDLIQGVAQLEGKELDAFIREILSIRARRQVPHASLDKREAELLEMIAEGPPAETWERFRELDHKREEENLTQEEQAELIDLTQELEAQNVQRLQCLAELALLRKTDLRTLMDQLGIAPSNG